MNRQFSFKTKSKYGLWRIIGLVVFALILSASAFMAYFIYQNAYNTLANANVIAILNSNLNVDIIDAKAHEDAQKAIALKNNDIFIPTDIKYIFAYAPTSTSATTTAKIVPKK